MADPLRRGSVRVRTTVAAVLVVALALGLGSIALVSMLGDRLRDGVESGAEQRAEQLAATIEADGPPSSLGADPDEDGGDSGGDDDAEEPDDTIVQVSGAGTVLVSSQPGYPIPTSSERDAALPGADTRYVVVAEEAEHDGREYVVSVAMSLEEVDDSVGALVPLLLAGLPLLLLVVGATTWVVVTRSLAPVERIRSQVATISDDHLDRRVPEPGSRDEVQRLAVTMNAMLDRLERSRDQQRRFVSDASHELRSPVASLRQLAEVARAHPSAFEPAELVGTVLGESARMQRLVEQLLVLTRTDEGGRGAERRDVDLDDLVLAEAGRLRRDGIEVDTSGVGPGRVRGDAVALSQVTRNLADNAARHARGRVALTVTQDRDGVLLVVEDDGPGVPPGERERVFDRFVRLDEARARDDGGSGLGLAIVREIAAIHGGRAWVEDSALGGAAFRIRLPGALEPS